MSDLAREGIVGVLFGFVLSGIGFSSWDHVHAMFTLSDLRMVLTFAVAVGVLAILWPLMRRRWDAPAVNRPIHRGTVAGATLFGAGWALCGACPSIAWVQLGEGQLGALMTLGGIFVGNWLYGILHARYFRWDVGGCASD